jgi:hypothetical protein
MKEETMPGTVIGDVCYATHKYAGQDGKEKSGFVKCGVLIQSEKGNFSIHLDVIPVGTIFGARENETGVWLSVFKKQERKESKPQQAADRAPGDDDESYPF